MDDKLQKWIAIGHFLQSSYEDLYDLGVKIPDPLFPLKLVRDPLSDTRSLSLEAIRRHHNVWCSDVITLSNRIDLASVEYAATLISLIEAVSIDAKPENQEKRNCQKRLLQSLDRIAGKKVRE